MNDDNFKIEKKGKICVQCNRFDKKFSNFFGKFRKNGLLRTMHQDWRQFFLIVSWILKNLIFLNLKIKLDEFSRTKHRIFRQTDFFEDCVQCIMTDDNFFYRSFFTFQNLNSIFISFLSPIESEKKVFPKI